MSTSTIDLEQLHTDALTAVETFRLGALDFEATCDFHRQYMAEKITATHAFKCRNCDTVELRCLPCVEYFAEIPHTATACEQCGFSGCFHAVVRVTPIGA